MKIFNKHLWCSYKQLYFDRLELFEGEEVKVEYCSDYRICKDCGKVQRYGFDSQGGRWSTLPSDKQEIVRKRIKEHKYHD